MHAQVGEQAVGEALYGLAAFHERQFGALRDEAASKAFAKLVSVQARTKSELRRTQAEIASLEGQSGNAAVRRKKNLEAHERELTVTLERDSLADAFHRERVDHLESSLDSYLGCLIRATPHSQTSRDAASALVRLWMRNREHAPLSHKMSAAVGSRRLDTAAFLPLSFQLTARLSGGSGAAAAESIDPLACEETRSTMRPMHVHPCASPMRARHVHRMHAGARRRSRSSRRADRRARSSTTRETTCSLGTRGRAEGAAGAAAALRQRSAPPSRRRRHSNGRCAR